MTISVYILPVGRCRFTADKPESADGSFSATSFKHYANQKWYPFCLNALPERSAQCIVTGLPEKLNKTEGGYHDEQNPRINFRSGR